MRKLLLIALLVIHFFGNTELKEIFRFPQLMFHYFQHSRQHPGLSFFAFLNMHYNGDDGTTADDFEDNKLPFHNPMLSHSFQIVYSPVPLMEIPQNISDNTEKIYGSQLQSGNSSEHVLLVLQPPRKV